jgi:exopolyphosphatase/guanosine-5'-triphosphate,3'-diphosphate pyrophosphatase
MRPLPGKQTSSHYNKVRSGNLSRNPDFPLGLPLPWRYDTSTESLGPPLERRDDVDKIVPRWEWRTFGQEFGPAEPLFAAIAAEKVQKSDEVYLLSDLSDANVKIRDQLLDIKILEHVDSNGLEQWRPVMKQPFPLNGTSIDQLCAALAMPSGGLAGDSLALDRLLAELTRAGGAVRVVDVAKTRTRYHIQGCVAELTDVIADGKTVRTAAIEDADPAKVIAAVRSMGLDGYANINYPRGLKQLIGMSIRGSLR